MVFFQKKVDEHYEILIIRILSNFDDSMGVKINRACSYLGDTDLSELYNKLEANATFEVCDTFIDFMFPNH